MGLEDFSPAEVGFHQDDLAVMFTEEDEALLGSLGLRFDELNQDRELQTALAGCKQGDPDCMKYVEKYFKS